MKTLMKIIENTISILLPFIIIFVFIIVAHLIMSFAVWEISPEKWLISTRIIAIFLYSIFAILGIGTLTCVYDK